MQIDLLQTQPVVGGREQALERLHVQLAASRRRDSDLLITPEMYVTGYNIGRDAVEAVAEPMEGPIVARLSELTRRHGVALLVGLPERAADGAIYNAAILLDAQGLPVISYRKTHLYGDADRAMFSPGQRLAPVVDFLGWRVGFAICYDIEFPELVRSHALAGAEAVLCPTANMLPYTGVPTRLVPARAEENEIYVAYANYVGGEGEFDYCGLSCLVGPDGEDRVRAPQAEAAVVTARLDRDEFDRIRRTGTHYRDRRAELYRNR